MANSVSGTSQATISLPKDGKAEVLVECRLEVSIVREQVSWPYNESWLGQARGPSGSHQELPMCPDTVRADSDSDTNSATEGSFAETALRLGGKSVEEAIRTGAIDRADDNVEKLFQPQ